MKVVINTCYGGFSVSDAALDFMRERGNHYALAETKVGETWPDSRTVREPFLSGYFMHDVPRNDPDLIACVEELGEEANGSLSSLKIVEIPDDVEWEIDEYDGMECVEEVHRSWS